MVALVTVTQLRPRMTIGGSDAAAAAGIDPHKSRVMLWLEKTGRYERPETEAMRWGKLLEPVVFDELERRDYAVTRASDYLAAMPNRRFADGVIVDPERPWCTGHLDATVYLDDYDAPAVLEVKTVGQWAKREWNGEPPLQYVAQVQHYLHLTELDRALLAALVGGQRLELHTITRDQRAIDLLIEREQDFYEQHLVRDVPPPPDSSESARDALAIMFPEAALASVMRLNRAQMELLRELHARREQRDAIDTQARELENQLKAAMGDAELAISPHDVDVIRWANVTTTRLDQEKVKAALPGWETEFATTTTTRRFTLL